MGPVCTYMGILIIKLIEKSVESIIICERNETKFLPFLFFPKW